MPYSMDDAFAEAKVFVDEQFQELEWKLGISMNEQYHILDKNEKRHIATQIERITEIIAGAMYRYHTYGKDSIGDEWESRRSLK